MKKNKPVKKTEKRGKRGWGYLYKRSSDGKEHPTTWNGQGVFYLAYRTGPTGNRQLVRLLLKDSDGYPITTKTEAEAKQRQIMAPITAGGEVEQLKARLVKAGEDLEKAVEESRGGLLVIEMWQAYLDSQERPDTGGATLRQYGFQWNRFERWVLETHANVETIGEITREHAQEYAGHLLNAGLSGNTINKHISLLSLVFRTLADAANITLNPWEKIARRNQTGKERRELTTEELRRISQTADGDMKLFFALGCYTGLRLGDCATLLWSEVGLDQGFIIRVPNKTASRGKPVRVPLFRDLATMLRAARKSASGEYVIPELAQLYEAGRVTTITDRVQRHFWNCGIDCHAKGTGHQIKRDADGNPELTVNGNAVLVPTGKRAVIRCGFHSLRHTFVSLCRQANAPLSVVEAIVGHSNPAMTRHYSHTGDAEAVKAIAALPAMDATDETPPGRSQAPQWIIELVKSMTPENLAEIRTEILKGTL